MCERHRMYVHKPWNLALTCPPYGWFFQASVPTIGRFHSNWKFAIASNFPPQSAYLGFPKILTTVVYAVRRWPKHRYAAHDCYCRILKDTSFNFPLSVIFCGNLLPVYWSEYWDRKFFRNSLICISKLHGVTPQNTVTFNYTRTCLNTPIFFSGHWEFCSSQNLTSSNTSRDFPSNINSC